MYRITYAPTGETIAIASTWQNAAATLRHHAERNGDETYSAVTADPSAILHLDTMGDGAYVITRDVGDLRLCDTCELIGIVVNQSDGYPLAAGSWSFACCAECAAQWERDNPREASDYRSHEIRHIATESRGLINDAALSHHLHHTGTA